MAVHRLVLRDRQDLHWRHSGVYSGNHVIAGTQAGHTRAHIQHHACAFMAQDGREQTFWVSARQSVVISMANARRLDLDQHFARFGTCQIDLFNR
jgi:hypothetical protein